jgi:hypothetical protein
MALYWLTYKRKRRLAGVAIVSASSLLAARARAAIDRSAMFAEGHQPAPEHAAHVPPDFVGRELSRKVASDEGREYVPTTG